MKYLIALVIAIGISGVCDAKCRRLGRIFGKKLVRPACAVVSTPACGSLVAEAAPVEVVIVEQAPLAQQATVEQPSPTISAKKEVPTPPAPAVSAEDIIGGLAKPPKDNSPTINFKLK